MDGGEFRLVGVISYGAKPMERPVRSPGSPDARVTYDGTNFYTDITDTNGYYLFDRLAPGNYFVYLPASNFTGAAC